MYVGGVLPICYVYEGAERMEELGILAGYNNQAGQISGQFVKLLSGFRNRASVIKVHQSNYSLIVR